MGLLGDRRHPMDVNSTKARSSWKVAMKAAASALLVSVMIVAAGATVAKDGGGGGKGGGGKGNGGKEGDSVFDSIPHPEIIRELIKLSDQPQPRQMGGHDDDYENQLRLPGYPIRHQSDRDAYCHAKYRSYNSLTGKYTAYSGLKRSCVVP
jgi:BA14K-like protein